jgi:P3 major capsid protein
MAPQKAPGGAGNPALINLASRQAVVNTAQNMWQPIFTQTLSGTLAGQVVTVPFRNVGLIKRFLVKISGSFAQGAAETQTITKFGNANVLSNITLTDLSNQVRINTTGWHLHFLASARRQAIFGAAYTTDSPASMGNVYTPIKMPSPVTTIQTWQTYYEVPVSYGDVDLRGAIYAGVVNATGQLQFTINPNFSVASTATETPAVYKSSTAQIGVLTAITVTVYQNYLDQLPRDQKSGATILPALDLAIAYDIKNTTITALSASNDNPISYANFRDFLSTTAVYDNQALNAATDITAWRIRAANYTSIIDLDPVTVALIGGRWNMSNDFPAGVYYFDHRAKPISTLQYGNMQLIINPSSVAGVASQVLVGWEALAYINEITNAGSLYGQ